MLSGLGGLDRILIVVAGWSIAKVAVKAKLHSALSLYVVTKLFI